MNYVRRNPTVILTIKTQHGCVQVRQVGFHFRMPTIENDTRTDLVILCRSIERESAAHAEANDADLIAGCRILGNQIVNSSTKISFSLIDAQRHHQLAGFIRRFRRLAMIQIRRKRDEALIRKALANVFDVIYKPPPLLNHDHSRTTALFRRREISASVSTCKRELDHFTHDLLSYSPSVVRFLSSSTPSQRFITSRCISN